MKFQSYSGHCICVNLMFPTWYILYLEVGTLLVATHVSIGMSSAAYVV